MKSYICKICKNTYTKCKCPDKEEKIYFLIHGYKPDKLAKTRLEHSKNDPTGTWCDKCNAPRNELVCSICGSLLTPNFWSEI